jgi:alkanesulfonate monooxygenase SsuD/methylene tetrahydromethanopterin reductase-like flavin-dependent oxidoreductase (luciferase family)
MLGLIAQYADVWNTAWFGAAPGPKFIEQRDRLHDECVQRGRAPETLEISVGVLVKADDADPDAPGIIASTDAVAEALAAWRDAGVAEVLIWADPPTAKRLEMIAAALSY